MSPDACQIVAYTGSDASRPDALTVFLPVTSLADAVFWEWSCAERRVTQATIALDSHHSVDVPLPDTMTTFRQAHRYLLDQGVSADPHSDGTAQYHPIP